MHRRCYQCPSTCLLAMPCLFGRGMRDTGSQGESSAAAIPILDREHEACKRIPRQRGRDKKHHAVEHEQCQMQGCGSSRSRPGSPQRRGRLGPALEYSSTSARFRTGCAQEAGARIYIAIAETARWDRLRQGGGADGGRAWQRCLQPRAGCGWRWCWCCWWTGVGGVGGEGREARCAAARARRCSAGEVAGITRGAHAPSPNVGRKA
ncbi:hypothetical protein EDC01DRAFT_97978 [Geopyxis carbonaria]|nr:hypothetical protein EDC01DRAFT_97978 [Geopyxis carbonaria]